MIKKLQKKINVLFVLLLSIIWAGVLFIYISNTYQNNLLDLKQDVRSTIKETGWKHFISSDGTAADLGDIAYCAYSLDENHEPHILFHTFSNLSPDHLIQIARHYSNDLQIHTHSIRYACIYKYKHTPRITYMVLISGRSALQATLPSIMLCVVLLFAGLFLFFLSGRVLSHWLTQPIEDMIHNEQKFISNASHELKTPLSVIHASSDLLQAEVASDNKHLQYIRQETDRMITLVNQMLTLARLDTAQNQMEPKRFQVDTALYDIIYPMESIAYEKKICITTDIQKTIFITGIEEQIQNLLSILLNNAISYTPENGEIIIRSYIQSKKWHLRVANTGDPIPKELREHLFERFFRADEARENDGHYGLGLSIASSIVSHHRGHISIDYEDHKNVFSIVIPICQ